MTYEPTPDVLATAARTLFADAYTKGERAGYAKGRDDTLREAAEWFEAHGNDARAQWAAMVLRKRLADEAVGS